MTMIQRTNLRQQLRDELRERILDGRLSASSPIREPSLAAELGVSRTPLREALISLQRDGLLTAQAGRGFAVAPLATSDVLNLYPILADLHGLALHLGGVPDNATLKQLRSLNVEMRRVAKAPKRLFNLDRTWHALLLAHCPNTELLGLIETYNTRSQRYDLAYWREYGDANISIVEHSDILKALSARSLAKARRTLTTHWMSCVPKLEQWLTQSEDHDR
jgi:DNA-binding GntR family transcriptional regulator